MTQLTHSDHQTTGKKFPLCFLLIDVERPENVGSVFRIADALGVEKVFLSGKSVVPPNKKIRKVSRTTERFVPYSYEEKPEQIIHALKAENYRVVSLEIAENSKPLHRLSLSSDAKVCLVLGSESHGINDNVLALSDEVVHIPMLGENSSMNVANACSIATYVMTQAYLDTE
ncbi:TrmH family RNA methyltransferase [Sessilibacter corallicola]|uniref:TrmH family RNA methyltransferase n=1 Tax=Sessilibacter corallicola TaxID=2904075 RepID=UPI001E358F15|nr:TrmH family RNA methyltransferase [Sessilibacter corallicola]MCE2027523.1 hypothetical protein [Sessilibacter corallicola]